jgi:hypothetical protein
MAGPGNFDVSVQLRLLDNLTNQVQRPISAMNQLRTSIGQASGEAQRQQGVMARLAQSYDHLAQRAERAAERMRVARGRALRAAVGLFTLAGPLADAASFQLGSLRLLQIDEWDKRFQAMTGRSAYTRAGGRPQLTPEGMEEMNKLLREQTQEFVNLSRVTNQSAQDLQEAYTTIVGRSGSELNRSQILEALRAIGIAATASGADVQSLTRSFIVSFQNLGVLSSSAERYFDIMHMGGKIGGFELKDSAQHFPRLASAMSQLMGSRRTILRQSLIDKGLTGSELDQQWARLNNEFGLDLTAALMGYLQIAHRANPDAETTAYALDYMIQKTGLQEFELHARKYTDFSRLAQLPDWQLYQLGDVGRYVDRRTNMLTRGTGRGSERQNRTFNWSRYLQDMEERGVDPVLASLRFMRMVQKLNPGDQSILTKYFNAHQELRAIRPLLEEYNRLMDVDEERRKRGENVYVEQSFVEQWNHRLRNARGIIGQDAAAAAEMLTYRFMRLTHEARNFLLLFTEGGALGPVSKFFGLITAGLVNITELAQANRGPFDLIAKTFFGIVTGLGALAIVRFLWAGIATAFWHAGMGAVTLLRVMPGLSTLLGIGGAFGGIFGFLAKLGLIGGAGFLGYQYWGDIKGYIEPVLAAIRSFFERLTVLFPGLNNLFTGFSAWTGDIGTLFGLLGRIGGDLLETLMFLFGAGGDPAAFERFKNGMGELVGYLMQAVPALRGLVGWWDDFKNRLMFRGTWGEGLGAWAKTLLAAFSAFSAWAVGTHGATGFLLILMVLRSALFIVGMLVGALQVAATLLNILMVPLFQGLIDRFGASLVFGFWGGIGVLALMFYALGMKGVKALFSGFFSGVDAETSSARARFGQAWDRLMRVIFGDADEDSILRLGTRAQEWGRYIGGYLATGLEKLADAIDYLSATLEGFRERHPVLAPFLERLGAGFLAFSAAIAALGGGLWIIRGLIGLLWRLSGIPIAWTILRGGWRLMFGTVAGAGAMAGLRQFMTGMATGGLTGFLRPGVTALAGLMTMGPTLMGLGPIGWATLLVIVLALVITHLEEIKSLFAGANEWISNSALGKLLGFSTEAPPPVAPGTESLLGAPQTLMSGGEMWRRIQGLAAQESADQIREGGRNVASALNEAAAALATAAAKLAGVAGKPGAVAGAIDGGLHDGAIESAR